MLNLSYFEGANLKKVSRKFAGTYILKWSILLPFWSSNLDLNLSLFCFHLHSKSNANSWCEFVGFRLVCKLGNFASINSNCSWFYEIQTCCIQNSACNSHNHLAARIMHGLWCFMQIRKFHLPSVVRLINIHVFASHEQFSRERREREE